MSGQGVGEDIRQIHNRDRMTIAPEAGNGYLFPAGWLCREITDLLIVDPDLLGYASA